MNNANRLEELFNTVDALKPDLSAGNHKRWTFSNGTLFRDDKPVLACKKFMMQFFSEQYCFLYEIELETGEQVRGYVPIIHPEIINTGMEVGD